MAFFCAKGQGRKYECRLKNRLPASFPLLPPHHDASHGYWKCVLHQSASKYYRHLGREHQSLKVGIGQTFGDFYCRDAHTETDFNTLGLSRPKRGSSPKESLESPHQIAATSYRWRAVGQRSYGLGARRNCGCCVCVLPERYFRCIFWNVFGHVVLNQ